METKNKRLIDGEKSLLLSLLDYLVETISNNNNNSNSNSNNNNNNNNNESVNDNDDYEEEYYKTKQINNWFKKIDKAKSFEE